jgi:hypothetical protein
MKSRILLNMKANIIKKVAILILLVTGLPLAGIMSSGDDIRKYLEFPPKTKYMLHEAFSMKVFVIFLILITLTTAPLIYRFITAKREQKSGSSREAFPWWGYAGLILMGLSWIAAWNRFKVLSSLQVYTFTPLWISYILTVNALLFRKTGRSMLSHNRKKFLLLFPASAAFWWIFEFLNRFVQNWYYNRVADFNPWEYFFHASISFSTVLPAVLGTRDLLLAYRGFRDPYINWIKINPGRQKSLSLLILALSAAGLSMIGLYPNILFPLLWVSPGVIIICLKILNSEETILSGISAGNWSRPVASCAAALICGFFWEMWNYQSMAKWIYSIPSVHVLLVFEMPVLGYAGYLPFGIECSAVEDLLFNRSDPDS